MFKFLSQFFDEKKYFLSTVEVSSYIPGRIRCYSSLIKNNHENALILEDYFSKFDELNTFKINEVTGSVLIEYDADKVTRNPELREIEEELKKKASKTYSVVGKTVTYVSYRTKDSNPVKTTKKITPTTPTAKPVPYQIANPTPTPEDKSYTSPLIFRTRKAVCQYQLY